jgi:hypothetical protein
MGRARSTRVDDEKCLQIWSQKTKSEENTWKVNVKLFLCLIKELTMKAHGNVKVQHSSIAALGVGEWSASRSGRVGPRAGMDAGEKRKILESNALPWSPSPSTRRNNVTRIELCCLQQWRGRPSYPTGQNITSYYRIRRLTASSRT